MAVTRVASLWLAMRLFVELKRANIYFDKESSVWIWQQLLYFIIKIFSARGLYIVQTDPGQSLINKMRREVIKKDLAKKLLLHFVEQL